MSPNIAQYKSETENISQKLIENAMQWNHLSPPPLDSTHHHHQYHQPPPKIHRKLYNTIKPFQHNFDIIIWYCM